MLWYHEAERETVEERLDPASQLTLRKMFTLCLIHPGEGTEDTRRRTARLDLLAVSNNHRGEQANYNLAMTLEEKAGLVANQDHAEFAWRYALAALSRDLPQNKTSPAPLGHFYDPKVKRAASLL